MPTVLYICRGGQIGGSQKQMYYLITGLDRTLYQPLVICREQGPFLELLRHEGIDAHFMPLHPWRKWPGAYRRFADARKLLSFARRRRAKIIHAIDFWQSGYTCNTAHYLNVPAVLHARTPYLPKRLHKYYCREVAAIIAISNRVQANLINQGVPQEKVTLIRDGVDLELFNPRLRKENILRRQFRSAKGPLLGIAGRLSPAKRQLDFLHSARRLLQTCHNVTFFVIGEPVDKTYLQQMRTLIDSNGLSARVFFTGHRNDMPQVLASLDALVTLSGGSVMIEAMACATPVVSAAFTPAAYSTIVQHERTGLLIPSTEVSDLDPALRRIVESTDLRQRLGRQARLHAENMFNYIDMVRATEKLYERICHEGYSAATKSTTILV